MQKEAFVREINISSWKEAESLLEESGGKVQFLKFKVKKGRALPKDFEVAYTHIRVTFLHFRGSEVVQKVR